MATAAKVDWAFIPRRLAFIRVQPAAHCHRAVVARQPRRANAVKNIDARRTPSVRSLRHAFIRYHGLSSGRDAVHFLNGAVHVRFGLTDRQSADGVPGKPIALISRADSARKSEKTPPCTIPNKAWSPRVFASRRRRALTCVRRIASGVVIIIPGTAHSSKAIMISAAKFLLNFVHRRPLGRPGFRPNRFQTAP